MSAKSDMIDKVKACAYEDADELIKDVWAFCRATKARGEPKEYFTHLHASVVKALTDEQRHLILNGPEKQGASLGDTLEKYPTLQLAMANEILDPLFKKVLDTQQGIIYCDIVDTEHQILKPIRDKDAARDLMEASVAKKVKECYQVITTSLTTEMVKLWKNHAESIGSPAPMLRLGEPGWCYHRPLIDVREGEFPAWQSVLDRLSDAEAFCAFVWGIYSGEYQGRNLLWLHGETGEEGKSAVAKAIGELFGSACEAISNAQFNGNEKRFVTSFFVNSRLVIYPDANNTHALLSEQFKMVCSGGSDKVPIEFKGKQAYSDYLNARMIVCSNYHPHITNDNFLLSRLLYVHIDPYSESPDIEAPKRIKEEFPFFLHYAQHCYQRKCPDHYTIETLATTQDLVKEIRTSSFEEFHEIFQANFTCTGDVEDTVTGLEMRAILKVEGLRSGREQKAFQDWLVKAYAVTKIKVPRRNTYAYTGLTIGSTPMPMEALSDGGIDSL
jgi:hypothetical protein